CRLSSTPNGHAGTQYPQPLQMSGCTTTVPNSVRKSDPVGQTSRQAACVQCLHTSDSMSQRSPWPLSCSTNATCRHVFASSCIVLSYELPVHSWPSRGMRFHSLHATSHALQPMQIDVSVKNPTRSCSYVALTTSSSLPRARRAAPAL